METPTSARRSARSTRTATPRLSERKKQLFQSRSNRLNNIEDDGEEPLLTGIAPLTPTKRGGSRGSNVPANINKGARKLLDVDVEPGVGRLLRSSCSSSPENNKENKRRTRGAGAVAATTSEEQLPQLFSATMRINSNSSSAKSSSPRTPKTPKTPERSIVIVDDTDESDDEPGMDAAARLREVMKHTPVITRTPRVAPVSTASSPDLILSSPVHIVTADRAVVINSSPESSPRSPPRTAAVVIAIASTSSPESTPSSPPCKQRKTIKQCITPMSFYSKASAASPESPRSRAAASGSSSSRRHSKYRSAKSRGITSPRRLLGINKGVGHKIRKPTRPATHGVLPADVDNILSALRNAKLRQLITTKREERAQIEEVHQVLRNAKDPIKMAKPLSTVGATDDANNNNNNNNNYIKAAAADFSDFSDAEEESDSAAKIELEPIIPLIKHGAAAPAVTEEEAVALGKRKFFKSGRRSSTCMEVRITDNIRASVCNGKIALMEQPPAKKARRVRVKSAATFSMEQATVDAILRNLDDSAFGDIVESTAETCEKKEPIEEAEAEVEVPAPEEVDPYEEYRRRLPYNTSDPSTMEQQELLLEFLISSDICTERNFEIFISDPDNHKEEATRIVDELYMVVNAAEQQAEEVEMIVDEQPSAEPETEQPAIEESVATAAPAKLFPIFTQRMQPLPVKSTRRRPGASARLWQSAAGSNQYQIDAGQKAYGARQCPQCGLVYTVHEAEEEQLHREYHDSVHVLRFKGWIDEDIVAVYSDWSSDGRVLRLNERAPAARLQRLTELLRLADKELGYASYIVPETFVAYLAVRKQQIVGLCLVQPLEQAHRFMHIDGTDYYSEEGYEASCGVSRIWVAPLLRRRGIAGKLLRAARNHTILGQEIPLDRIAFSSPTDDGRAFAQHMTQSDNFLTYQ